MKAFVEVLFEEMKLYYGKESNEAAATHTATLDVSNFNRVKADGVTDFIESRGEHKEKEMTL